MASRIDRVRALLMLPDPREVAAPGARPGHEPEPVGRASRVTVRSALDPAAAVQHLRVDDAARRARRRRSRRGAAAGPAPPGRRPRTSRSSSRRTGPPAPGWRGARRRSRWTTARRPSPRGRRSSCAGSSFERNQFARSQPAFSPNSASSASSRAYVGAIRSGPSGLVLLARVPDVVVLRVDLVRPSRARSPGSGTGGRTAGCPSSTGPSRVRPRRSTPRSTGRSRPRPSRRARRSPPRRRTPRPPSRRG